MKTMLHMQKVIVVIDPTSESQPGLQKVLQLSRLVDFDLKLIACEYTQYLAEGYYFNAVDVPGLRDEFLQEKKSMLEVLAQPLRDNGLTVETGAIWAHPGYKTIISEVESFAADLVVHHTRRHGAISRMFLTNDDWQLVRCCPVPLLLVKEKPWKEKPSILVAVDPMHSRHKPDGLDHKLIKVSGDIAQSTGGDVSVMHSYSQIPLSGTYLDDARQAHRAAFQNLLEDFDIPDGSQHLLEEAPEFALRQLEQDLSTDVIVMGAISRNILSDVFIGNTTEKVLDYLESDVLVIKPDGFKSPPSI
jgi:universal stress protein E